MRGTKGVRNHKPITPLEEVLIPARGRALIPENKRIFDGDLVAADFLTRVHAEGTKDRARIVSSACVKLDEFARELAQARHLGASLEVLEGHAAGGQKEDLEIGSEIRKILPEVVAEKLLDDCREQFDERKKIAS